MIIFVDYEHTEGHESELGQSLLAARTWITYRLEDVADQHCMLVRYDKISDELIKHVDAQAIFISGNFTDPARYDPAALQPLVDIIESTSLPMFGFCGGLQIIATALGAAVVPIELPADINPEVDERLRVQSNGRPFESGYHEVELSVEHGDHAILAGLGSDHQPVFRHAHGLHVPEPPAGFTVLASNDITRVQLAVNDERRIAGSQFHPEYWTDEHPAGRVLIDNFIGWAGLRA